MPHECVSAASCLLWNVRGLSGFPLGDRADWLGLELRGPGADAASRGRIFNQGSK